LGRFGTQPRLPPPLDVMVGISLSSFFCCVVSLRPPPPSPPSFSLQSQTVFPPPVRKTVLFFRCVRTFVSFFSSFALVDAPSPFSAGFSTQYSTSRVYFPPLPNLSPGSPNPVFPHCPFCWHFSFFVFPSPRLTQKPPLLSFFGHGAAYVLLRCFPGSLVFA